MPLPLIYAALIILCILSIVFLIIIIQKKYKIKQIQKVANDNIAKLDSEVQTYKEKVIKLSKYEGIADADEKAKAILSEANKMAEQEKQQAHNILVDAKTSSEDIIKNSTIESNKIIDGAKYQAKSLKENATNILDEATQQAKEITDQATKRAEEIAGKAYDALNKADLYEKTVKAMKNKIEGYGDEYIIPERSLLDDLGEEYGFTEAGEKLKQAREKTKILIKNNAAATCDYVEQGRKETAINFVLDAFNGKVDSILSRVKHDNAGTLSQEIKDAFTLVNYQGNAFRSAKISEDYLAARLDELKWGEVAQQIRIQEREEQRKIKEQMREEEKARKEYERAMRDSAKEEEYIKKAMEKAQVQIAQAKEEQKEKYENQLKELQIKLIEAEEKNKRALSMAQQTRKGYVYIISNIGSFGENVYKIGLTRRLEPLDRIKELGDSSVPFNFDVHALILSDDAPALEKNLHKHFILDQINKVNYRKEFFRVDVQHIKEELEKLGLQAKWTIKAEAAEYYETLAIEKSIKDNPEKRDAWLKQQYLFDEIESSNHEIEVEEVPKLS